MRVPNKVYVEGRDQHRVGVQFEQLQEPVISNTSPSQSSNQCRAPDPQLQFHLLAKGKLPGDRTYQGLHDRFGVLAFMIKEFEEVLASGWDFSGDHILRLGDFLGWYGLFNEPGKFQSYWLGDTMLADTFKQIGIQVGHFLKIQCCQRGRIKRISFGID